MLASGDRLLRVKEFAEALGFEADTIYRKIARNEISVVRIGRNVRIRATELDRLTQPPDFDAAAAGSER
jgi:excisionase family DNA binding protein